MDKIPSPFDQLIGQELSAITFVRDYIQLQFNPPPMLSIMTPITLETADGSIKQVDLLFPNTIIAQIGKTVIRMNFQNRQFIKLIFADESCISISLQPKDYVGAEALYYSGSDTWGVL